MTDVVDQEAAVEKATKRLVKLLAKGDNESFAGENYVSVEGPNDVRIDGWFRLNDVVRELMFGAPDD